MPVNMKLRGLAVLVVAACLALLQPIDAKMLGSYPSPNAALSSTPTLSKLWKSVQAAGLNNDKAFNGVGERLETTFFAPTDAAIDAYLASLNLTLDSFLFNNNTVYNTILHHIVSGYAILKPANWLYNGQILPTLLTRANGRSKLTVSKAFNASTSSIRIAGDLSIASLTEDYAQALQFRIILINGVLVPDLKSPPKLPIPSRKYLHVAQAISQIPGLETLWLTLQKNQGMLTYLSNPNLNATFFAPNNKALQYPPTTLKTTPENFISNTTYLDLLFSYHTVPNFTTPAANFTTNQKLQTLLPKGVLNVQLFHNHIVPAGALSKGKILIHLPPRLPSMSYVSKGVYDVSCGKAVLHVIDHWLLL